MKKMKQRSLSTYESIILKEKADISYNYKTIGYDVQLKMGSVWVPFRMKR